MRRLSLVSFLAVLMVPAHSLLAAAAADTEKKMHMAIVAGKLDEVQAMIASKEMNANSKLIGEKSRPLQLSIISSKPDIVKFLLDAGADVNFAGNQGLTPLMVSVGHMPIEVIKLLLDKGARLDAASDDGMTPLHWAAYRGNVAAIELFLEKGASIKAQSKGSTGGSMLHQAALGNRADAIKLLAGKGLSVDEQNQSGFTPIMLCARNGSLSAVETLLELKADVNKINSDKKKALTLAKERLAEKIASKKRNNPKFDEANPPQDVKDYQTILGLLTKAGATE